jgi:FAD/FMN-containing dehydrogenase
MVVALPETEAQVAAVLKACHALGGAGGGARCGHRPVGRRACRTAGA